MKDGGTVPGGWRQMTLIRVAHPQMKMARLPEWEIGLGRVRVGSPRNREEAMLAVPVRSTLTPQYSRCPTQVEADQVKQIRELQEQVAKLAQKGASGDHMSNAGRQAKQGAVSAQPERPSGLHLFQML